MDIWIVIIADRHFDIDAKPFTREEDAIAAAREAAAGIASRPGDVVDEPLGIDARDDGWVLYLPIGHEGDHVIVVKRQMDGD
jgi:hypothetical protein